MQFCDKYQGYPLVATTGIKSSCSWYTGQENATSSTCSLQEKNFSICSLQEKGQVFTLAILCVEEDTGEVNWVPPTFWKWKVIVYLKIFAVRSEIPSLPSVQPQVTFDRILKKLYETIAQKQNWTTKRTLNKQTSGQQDISWSISKILKVEVGVCVCILGNFRGPMFTQMCEFCQIVFVWQADH